MVSALYTGTVRHRRHVPVHHEFTYRQTLLYVDLDEAAELFGAARLWSMRRRAPGEFRRSDYHGDPATPLKTALLDTVERELGHRPAGPVRLLCRARTFGHVFNPVTFAYCCNADASAVEAVVAEVENTPWGERHAYVIDGLHSTMDKVFHVSPLMGMEHRYDVRATTPDGRLAVHIASSAPTGDPVFDATLLLQRRELDPRGLDRALLRWPAESLRAMALIYTNALKLKLKGAPYHPHPDRA